MKQFIFLLFFFTIVNTYTQQIENDSISEYIRISGDTIVKGTIGLNEVVLLPKRPFYNSDQIRKYLILKRKTLKVYPYSVMASDRLNSLNERLNLIKTKRGKNDIQRWFRNF